MATTVKVLELTACAYPERLSAWWAPGVDAEVLINGSIRGMVTLMPRRSDGVLDTWGDGLDCWASAPLAEVLAGNDEAIEAVVGAVRAAQP